MNITEKTKKNIDSCRFCWMCRHICPIGNATGLERDTARARALALSLVYRGAEKLEDMADNLYECSLCGACVKECVTGWNPVDFTLAARTEAAINGILPKNINKLIENFQKSGNIYGKDIDKDLPFNDNKDILVYFGESVRHKVNEAIYDTVNLLKKTDEKICISKNEVDSAYSLWFLTGKTEETKSQMQKCADFLNKYNKVIVYNPADLKLFLHEYKEYGIKISSKIISFNDYLLGLLEEGKIAVKKEDKDYTVQDNFNYSRELEDSITIRKIIEKVGKNKEMLMSKRDTMLAGNLIMNEYMPSVIDRVAEDRLQNLKGVGGNIIITESPDEYYSLKKVKTGEIEVLSVEQLILKSIEEKK